MKIQKNLTSVIFSIVLMTFLSAPVLAEKPDRDDDMGCPMMGKKVIVEKRMENCEMGKMGNCEMGKMRKGDCDFKCCDEMKRGMDMPDIPNLTEDQKAKIKKVHIEAKKDLLRMETELKIKNIEFQELMGDEADEGLLNSKIDEIGKIRTEIQKKQVGTMVAVRNLLTKEQKASLKKEMCPMMRKGKMDKKMDKK
ncbi:MAG: Spy/CpxP family protein refolding chaperone [bacterium]|nr:Spy/CpxP family protein refolding chaperone [bacterium]